MTKTTVVIDGDIVAFRCAAANETRSIRVTHKVTGNTNDHAHRTAFKEHIRGVFEIDEFDIDDVQTASDISYAYHAIDSSIDAIVAACFADEVEVYMSGEGNFRLELPLPTQYKGNREELLRPLQLARCREYLVTKYKAVKVDGKETDDKLAERVYQGVQAKEKIIQATLDKDANSNVGWLYNWNKMTKPTKISGLGTLTLNEKKELSGYSRKWFYAQWVLGDSTDGFKPCQIAGKKFGDVGAFNLLNECKDDKECVQAVYDQYKKWYPKAVTYKAWDGKEYTKNALDLMDLYAACAHMERWDGDRLNTREMLTKLGIEYAE